MKITMIGSHLCQDTLFAMMQLKAKGVKIDFQNVSANFPALKTYLRIRESDPMFEPIRKADMLGFPLLILEDGTRTFSVEDVLALAEQEAAGSQA